MRNLHRFPYWHPDHLGEPLPESEHATSVAMPTWKDVVGYEEGEARVVNALQSGYPRFKLHPNVLALAERFNDQLPSQDWKCLPFPSEKVAGRCLAFVESQTEHKAQILEPLQGLYPVAAPKEAYDCLLAFWQHCGDIISSRQAAKVLDNAPKTGRGDLAREILKARIALLAGNPSAPVWLFSTGMSAIAQVHRAVVARSPKPTVQFGFPYVDTLKIQEKMGVGVHFFPNGDEEALSRVIELAEKNEISAVFCECPTNPRLRVPDLIKLSKTLRLAGIPLVVDNTLDSFYNLDVLPYADVVATSLTKYFSSVGDVMGGSLVINPRSVTGRELAAGIDADYEDLLWDDDALALEKNSRNFADRMAALTANTQNLVKTLYEDDRISQLYYPENELNYRRLKRPDVAGNGAIFSLVLKNAEQTTPGFYDQLKVSKGPSLGTGFTLACAYTLLAHYHELEWAASCGISPQLIRVSVGEEDNLTGRFKEALTQSVGPETKRRVS